MRIGQSMIVSPDHGHGHGHGGGGGDDVLETGESKINNGTQDLLYCTAASR